MQQVIAKPGEAMAALAMAGGSRPLWRAGSQVLRVLSSIKILSKSCLFLKLLLSFSSYCFQGIFILSKGLMWFIF